MISERDLAALKAQIKSVEDELQFVKARIAKLEGAASRPRRFSDLYGILKGKAEFTYEEIRQAEIKLRELPQ